MLSTDSTQNTTLYTRQSNQTGDHVHGVGHNNNNNQGTYSYFYTAQSFNIGKANSGDSGTISWNGSGGSNTKTSVNTLNSNMVTTLPSECTPKDTSIATIENRPINFAVNYFIKY